MLLGIDTSYDSVTLPEARRLREKGIQVALQCLWTGIEQPPPRVTNLRNYIGAGMIVMGYVSLPTGATGGINHFYSAKSGVPDEIWNKLVRVVADVELPGITTTAIRDLVDTTSFHKKGKTIYTSYSKWREIGNPTGFSDCDLMNAFWDNDPDKDFDRFPYGDFRSEKVISEQYTGGQDVFGVYADRNVWYTTREALLGTEGSAAVDAQTGLLRLKIAWLEQSIKALHEGDAKALKRVAEFYGG